MVKIGDLKKKISVFRYKHSHPHRIINFSICLSIFRKKKDQRTWKLMWWNLWFRHRTNIPSSHNNPGLAQLRLEWEAFEDYGCFTVALCAFSQKWTRAKTCVNISKSEELFYWGGGCTISLHILINQVNSGWQPPESFLWNKLFRKFRDDLSRHVY